MLTYPVFKSQLILFLVLVLSTANALAAEPPRPGRRFLVIDKADQHLVWFLDGKKAARFPVSFGVDPNSDKIKVSDCATPEGRYAISYKKNPSRFHRTLGLSYPTLANAEKGLAGGVISLREYRRISGAIQKFRPAPHDTRLGGGIAIHGGGVFRYFGKARERDWTEGCVALNDPDIEKLFDECLPGDAVIIYNSRRNLYGIIRPFTRIQNVDGMGVPVCPDGVCTYWAELPTSLGRTVCTLREGKGRGRSLQVRVYKAAAREKPILVLVDRNADGRLSVLDSVSGPLSEKASSDAVYKMVREAVTASLSMGRIWEPVRLREPGFSSNIGKFIE